MLSDWLSHTIYQSFQHLSTLSVSESQSVFLFGFLFSKWYGMVRLPLGLSQLRRGESSAPAASQNVLAKVWQHSAKPRFVGRDGRVVLWTSVPFTWLEIWHRWVLEVYDQSTYRDHQRSTCVQRSSAGCLHATLTTPYPIGWRFLQMFSIFLRLELAVTYWYNVSICFLYYKWCIWFWFYMFAWFSKNEERNWPVFSKAWRQDHPRPIPTVLGHEYKLQLGKLMCVVGPLWKGWG